MSQHGNKHLSGYKFDITWGAITFSATGVQGSSFRHTGNIEDVTSGGTLDSVNVTDERDVVSGTFILKGDAAQLATVDTPALMEVLTVSNSPITAMDGTYNCREANLELSDNAARLTLTMDRPKGGAALAAV